MILSHFHLISDFYCPKQTTHYKILVKFWIINLMNKPNKPYDTTPRLDTSI